MRLTVVLSILTAVVTAAPVAAPDSDSSKSTSAAYSSILSVVAKQSAKFSHAKRQLSEKDTLQDVHDTYVIVFNSDASVDDISAEVQRLDFLVDDDSSNGISSALDLSTYTDGSGFIGFVGQFNSSIVDSLKKSPLLSIEKNVVIKDPSVGPIQPDSSDTAGSSKRDLESRKTGLWGQSRVSHKHRQADKWDYVRETSALHPTVAYVVDSGVRITHEQFEGRATWGANFIDNVNTDVNGHGTHVAGTVAGKTFGVDPNAHVIAVKVFGGEYAASTNAIVLQGFTWALNDYISKRKTNPRGVLNYSGSVDAVIASQDAILTRAVKEGLTVAVAAGNSARDACEESPANIGASVQGVITVGAIDVHDNLAVFQGEPGTNYGKCVDVFGPGKGILSAYYTSDNATAWYEGTSMASPHVAGLASYYLSTTENLLTPAQIENLIVKSNTGVLTGDLKGSPNAVAYNGSGK